MAVRSFTVEQLRDHKGASIPGALLVTWSGLLNGDTGAPYVPRHQAEMTVQIDGAPGATGNVLIQGTNGQVYGGESLNPTELSPDYVTLEDAENGAMTYNAAAITANTLARVRDKPAALRPSISAGDGSTNVVVRLVLRNQPQG